MFHEVRGKGLMIGLQFGPPQSKALRRRFNTLEHLRPAIFSQMMVVPLFHRHRILTQVAADNVNIIKLLPPLICGQEEIDYFVGALDDVLKDAHSGTGLLFEFGRTMAKGALRQAGKARPDAAYEPPTLDNGNGNGERERIPAHLARARSSMSVNPTINTGDRVVVTGAAGFIGSAVVRALLARKAEVVALVEPGGDVRNLQGLDVERSPSDVRDARCASPRPAMAHGSSSIWRPCTGSGHPDPRTSTTSTSAACSTCSTRPARRVRAGGLHQHGRRAGTGRRRPRRGGRRDLLRRRRPSVRPLQEDQVRGRTRGAARRSPGRAGLTRAPDLPDRPGRRQADADRKARAGLPQRKDPGLRRHHAQRGPRGRPRRPGIFWRSSAVRSGAATSSAGRTWAWVRSWPVLPRSPACRLRNCRYPGAWRSGVGALSQLVEGRILKREPFAALEAARMSTTNMMFNDARARQELGYSSRPASEAMADSARWFAKNGYVNAKRLRRMQLNSSS